MTASQTTTTCCAHAHTDAHGDDRRGRKAAGRVSHRKRAGVILATGALMLGGGVAYAAWTHSGTGTATAQATTATAINVSPGTPVGALYPEPTGGYPTGTVGSIYATVANPNNYPVQVTTVTIGSVTITPLSGRTCAAGSVVATGTGTITLATPVTLAANSGPTALTVPGALRMLSSAEDGCQGASFSAPITVTAL